MDGIHQKMCWNYIKKESLWAQFLQCKYGSPDSVMETDRITKCYHIWSIIYPRIKRLMEEHCMIRKPFNGSFCYCYKLSTIGKFNEKLWKQLHSPHRSKNPLKVVQNKDILWKVWNNGLSTNQNVQKVGISLASKCKCCSKGAFEPLELWSLLLHIVIWRQLFVVLWSAF